MVFSPPGPGTRAVSSGRRVRSRHEQGGWLLFNQVMETSHLLHEGTQEASLVGFLWYGSARDLARAHTAVGIATGYRLDDQGVGVRVPLGARFFSSTSSRPVLGPTQPPIQWVPGTFSPGVMPPGLEADHSSLTSAEVNNTWIYTSTPYAFMA
jgi:hypothetical protein